MDFRFCPKCSASLDKRQQGSDEHERLVCTACEFVFYQNSKPCVAVLVVRDDGQILLAKRGIEPYKGWWDLPGGFLELGEHPEEGVVREMQEETGLEVKPGELVSIIMDYYGEGGDATMNLVYVAEPVTGTPTPSSDVEALEWFSPDELPEQIAFQCNRQAIAAWRDRAK